MNNQMPMGGGFQSGQYFQQNMNPQQPMPQQQPMMQQPQPVEEKKGSKKIFTLVILLTIALVIFLGSKYIRYITVNYKEQIDTSLTKYYVSDNKQDLDDIKNLLETYKKNPKMIQNIQNYTYSQVSNWLTFTYNKYTCDARNFNSCLVKLDQFNKLLKKIDTMYTVRGGGYYVISTSGFQELKSKGNSVVDELTAVSRNRASYSSPQNSETIHTNRCKVAKDCNCNSNTGICACKFDTKDENGNNVLGDVVCYKPETIQKR